MAVDELPDILRARNRRAIGDRLHVARLDLEHPEPHVVIEIEGDGKDDIVSGPCEDHHRRREGLVASGRDGDMGRRNLPAILVRHMPGECHPQLIASQDSGIEVSCRLERQPPDLARELLGRWIFRQSLTQVDEQAISP